MPAAILHAGSVREAALRSGSNKSRGLRNSLSLDLPRLQHDPPLGRDDIASLAGPLGTGRRKVVRSILRETLSRLQTAAAMESPTGDTPINREPIVTSEGPHPAPSPEKSFFSRIVPRSSALCASSPATHGSLPTTQTSSSPPSTSTSSKTT